MAKLKLTMSGALLFGALVLVGCGGGGVYYAGVAVGPPPPPPVYGPVGVAPGIGYVWVPGYYDLVGSRWVFRRGEWRRPPDRDDRWVEPRWERHGNAWVRHGGRWQRRGRNRDRDRDRR